MKQIFIAMTIMAFIQQLLEAKVTSCRNTLRHEDWIYCAKFGTPAELEFEIELRARYSTIYRKATENNEVEIGMYSES